ncbi:MAG: FtsW/RodA/SpoVE family cell cycle protein [Eggerthellaceae bacterium]|nr:FtsW/RodA/SpoVE family cell cycle protein [Eggerthellaceae bacterium]
MTRRNTELLLLCIAAPLVVVLFAMLALNSGAELGWKTLGVPLGLFGAFVVAHFAVRKFAPEADPAILPLSFALAGIGITFVTRLAPALATRQVIWLYAGIALMVITLILLRNLDKVANYKYTLMIVGVILLLSPMVPGLGQEIYGSRIWLSVGPFSFQTGEIAKILIVLFLASYLSANRELLSVFTWEVGPFRLPAPATLIPLLVMWVIALLVVVFEKDLGSALVFFLVFLVMLYVATGKKFYLAVGLGLAALAAVMLYSAFGHVQTRVETWLDPFADAQGGGYQLVQTIYSLADGGLFGVGIGNGLAESIPVVESDFIFAAIAEELGLLGAAGILLLFLSFAIRGMVVAARAKSDVSSLIATGLTTIIVVQAFIIVGGVTRLIPLTGLTLPFISQGGSSLLASFIIVGFLLRCGDEGTGLEHEMASVTSALHVNSVLGRVSLGKRLTNTMVLFSVMFALLVANLTYIMVIKADEYQNMPGNNHTIARQADSERGTISTSDGVVLARSVQNEEGHYYREYPAGDLASHVVGYYSTRFGTSGIEAYANETLEGKEDFATWTDVIDSMAGIKHAGNDVTLTIDSTIQRAAQNALSGYTGACVVMDAETGAVFGLASSPTYDAADFVETIENSSDSSALYNRATQALYAPGSTFKIVSLATALENGVATEETLFDSPGEIEIGNAMVTNINKKDHGEITLARATELSSNTVFGQLGAEMGAKMLVSGAEDFGFNQLINFELPFATSLMPNPKEMTEWETAWAAAGVPVGEHESPAGPQASVLEMALVGCAIANEGTIMQPYLIDGVYNSLGERSYTARGSKLMQAVSADTANRVLKVLEGVVENGTGAAAQVSGASVAGKTGTAERVDGDDDSWFVGITPSDSDGRKIVVALVLENGGSGTAAARAQNVLATALDVEGLR